ncbi:MAG TPA: HD domain-containing protein [Solirubrobacteraceae bacterium]|nr:HD domain-containing protein [Solirubrobacteraceae bacterium]
MSTQRHEAASGGAEEGSRTIATLRDRDELDGVFACTRKERQVSRAGTPYLNVELGDKTGTILARAFNDADLLAGRFERGELVHVRGRVERYRDQLQVNLAAIERASGEQAEPESFLPKAYRDLDELEGFLEHLAREVYDPPLRGLLDKLLADRELRAELRRAPCSVPGQRSAHHAYLGGLLEHTVGVATLAHELCALHPRLDRDLLLCAAVVHDLGKTREFTYGAEITRSAEGRMLGHVELGLRTIAPQLPGSLRPERRLALEHCVLMHHGVEQTSGARFASAEALALYRINAVDAQVKGAFEQGLGAQST